MTKKVDNNDDDYFSRPNNLRELMLSEHLLPFLMLYMKHMSNESIELFLHPLCVRYLDEIDCPYDDLSGLTGEQLVEFKELFMANRTEAHRGLSKQIDTILDFMIEILAKRVPSDKATVKIDAIHSKVKLVPLPEDIINEDFKEEIKIPNEDGSTPRKETVQKKANVSHQAILYIKVGQYEEEEEVTIDVISQSPAESEKDKKEGEEEKKGDMEDDAEPKFKTVVKMVDEDQQGKALAIIGSGIPNLANQTVYSINQYACKAYREHFLAFIKQTYPEFFDENKDYDDIFNESNKCAEKDIQAFIGKNCQKYEKPCLEFQFNAIDI